MSGEPLLHPDHICFAEGAEAHVAAGAIFVISSEDIRRSGMSNVAELLRTVLGLDVAKIDTNKRAITSRGFSERFADKMLVLLDGRTLYTPLSSGVNWGAGNGARRSATLPRTSPP
jgi:outer membrane receptor for ferrienterochelin and colicin